jgi:hypothetical protein
VGPLLKGCRVVVAATAKNAVFAIATSVWGVSGEGQSLYFLRYMRVTDPCAWRAWSSPSSSRMRRGGITAGVRGLSPRARAPVLMLELLVFAVPFDGELHQAVEQLGIGDP